MNILTSTFRLGASLASANRKPKPGIPNLRIFTLLLGWLLLLLLLLTSEAAVVFLVETATTLIPKIHVPINSLSHDLNDMWSSTGEKEVPVQRSASLQNSDSRPLSSPFPRVNKERISLSCLVKPNMCH